MGVGKDFFRSAGGDYGALIDDVRPGANAQGLAHIMVSDEHPDTALRELAGRSDLAIGLNKNGPACYANLVDQPP